MTAASTPTHLPSPFHAEPVRPSTPLARHRGRSRCTPRLARRGHGSLSLRLALSGLLFLAILLPAAVPAQVPDVAAPFRLVGATEAAGDLFGCALDAAGRTAVVGSLLDDERGRDAGAVYVFSGDEERAKLFAPDAGAGDRFGYSVALDGDAFLAGAPFHDGVAGDAGAAYVFRRQGEAWTEEARFLPTDLAAFDQLGFAVALDGEVAAVAAPGDDTRGAAAGAVHVFVRADGGGWQRETKLTGSAGAAGDGLGSSLALAGGTLVVGAPFAGAGQEGAAWVFQREGNGWREVARLEAPDRRAGALFGSSVAIGTGFVAVGARRDAEAGRGAGAVYLFRRDGLGFEAKLTAASPRSESELGSSVALGSGPGGLPMLLAGARFDTVGGSTGAGAAHLFVRRQQGWNATARLVAADPAAGDELGIAVALAGNDDGAGSAAVLGAYRADPRGADSGAVWRKTLGEPPRTDLALAKESAPPRVTPGDPIAWTVTVANEGPSDVAAGQARVVDRPPDDRVEAVEWTCAALGGAACGTDSGTGDLVDAPALPAGGRVVYSLEARVLERAQREVVNRACLEVLSGVEDTDPANDCAETRTPIDRPAACRADLEISKVAEVDSLRPGVDPEPLELPWTVTVRNLGPDAVAAPNAAFVSDPVPAQVDSLRWTCAGGACEAPEGTGPVAEFLELPVSAEVVFELTGTVSATANGTIDNVARVTSDCVDPDPGNDSATTSTPVEREPRSLDLAVALEVALDEAGEDGVAPGGEISWTATVSNPGEVAVSAPEALVTLPPPTQVVESSLSWTCSPAAGPAAACGAPSGTGGIVDRPVLLEPGGALVYRLDGMVAASAKGEVVASASVGVEPPLVDVDPANDSDEVETPVLAVDLAISKKALAPAVAPGDPLSWVVTVRSVAPGPAAPVSALVLDPVPAQVVSLSWTCSASPDAACGAPAGTGDLADEATLAVGAIVIYKLTGEVAPGATGQIVDVATVEPLGVSDCDPSDNRASTTTPVDPGAKPPVLPIPTLGRLPLLLLVALVALVGWRALR